MGLYNFKKRFVPMIESGEKTHTIRAIRANPDRPGNVLHLYTGLRQKGARLLGRYPCVKVEEIVLWVNLGHPVLEIDGVELAESEREQLAKRDGFLGGWSEMWAYWSETHDLPFHGHVIHWRKK